MKYIFNSKLKIFSLMKNWVSYKIWFYLALGFLGLFLSFQIAVNLWHWQTLVQRNFVQLQITGDDKDKKRFDASLSIANGLVGGIGTVATIVGGIMLILNFRVAIKNTKIAEDRLVAERFTKAVEQVSSEKIEVRLGGIYSLERISEDSPKDYWTVMEVLTAFVRKNSPISALLHEETSIEIAKESQDQINMDIQATLTVVGRRNCANDSNKGINLDLSQANLSGAKLYKSNFNRAFFWGSNFKKADISRASFREADFSEACLVGTDVWKSDLSEANLWGANLYEAYLCKAVLNGANLENANLENADIESTDLREVKGLTLSQIKSAKNWKLAIYDDIAILNEM
ncbi:MAG: hypothetical protein B0A82_18845 [Alkalinema sp. CACIAM 70d]|nr:MAG: hypothetical protein B0A82_18845 [Alkalinema sp. CACIAM 70d]